VANGGVIVVVSGQDDTGKVFEAIAKHLKNTTERAHETESALGQLGERAKRYLEYAGIALGVRETIDSFKEVVTKSAEFGQEMINASQRTGLAVETLSTLHFAAALTGEDFDGAARSVSKLAVSLGEAADGGNKKALSTFQALGLNASDLAKREGGVETAFQRVSQAMASNLPIAQKAVIAKELLGRAGQQEIALLAQIGSHWDEYRAKAQAAGVFMTTSQAEALEQLSLKLNTLKQELLGDALAFTDGFIPSFNRMLDVIIGGPDHLKAFAFWGDKLARTLATLAEGALVTASSLEYLWAGPSDLLNKDRQKELANARELYAKSQKMYAEVHGDHPETKGAEPGSLPKPFKTPDLSGDAGADRLDAALKAREAARTRLSEQEAQLRAQIAKAAEDRQLAQLESDHASNLLSDRDYYANKLAIEKAGLDAQRQAAVDKQKEIDAEIEKLDADAKKHGGNAKERAIAVEDQTKILELRAKRLTLDGEIAKINADGAKAEIEAAQKLYDLSVKQALLVDDLAAKREAITGGSVDDRLHQSADTYDVKRKELVANFGEGSKEVSDADFAFGNEQGQIRAKGAEETEGLAAADINARRTQVSDAEARGSLSTLDAQRQRIALDQEEARALGPVLEAYEQLAQSGDLQASEKVIELKTRIAELKEPVDEVAQHMRESFDGAFESLFDNLDQGLKGFEGFVRNVEHIFEDAAYKKLIEPFVQAELGKLIPNSKGYGDPGIGGVNPLPANPKTDIGGGAVRAAASIGSALGIPGLGGAEKKGGAGITITLENESGLPLKLGDIKTSGNVDKDQVISILKDNFEEGGFLRSLLTGFHA